MHLRGLICRTANEKYFLLHDSIHIVLRAAWKETSNCFVRPAQGECISMREIALCGARAEILTGGTDVSPAFQARIQEYDTIG